MTQHLAAALLGIASLSAASLSAQTTKTIVHRVDLDTTNTALSTRWGNPVGLFGYQLRGFNHTSTARVALPAFDAKNQTRKLLGVEVEIQSTGFVRGRISNPDPKLTMQTANCTPPTAPRGNPTIYTTASFTNLRALRRDIKHIADSACKRGSVAPGLFSVLSRSFKIAKTEDLSSLAESFLKSPAKKEIAVEFRSEHIWQVGGRWTQFTQSSPRWSGDQSQHVSSIILRYRYVDVASRWTDLGGASVGHARRSPVLDGNADQQGASFRFSFCLSGAKPTAPGVLFLSGRSWNVSLFGARLIPDLSASISLPFATDAKGRWGVSLFPAPQASTFYFQAWVFDDANPFGLVASNGLRCKT